MWRVFYKHYSGEWKADRTYKSKAAAVKRSRVIAKKCAVNGQVAVQLIG